jgi:hypothetical protein
MGMAPRQIYRLWKRDFDFELSKIGRDMSEEKEEHVF